MNATQGLLEAVAIVAHLGENPLYESHGSVIAQTRHRFLANF